MKLTLRVEILGGGPFDPQSAECIEAAHAAASREASTWTEPVYSHTVTDATGSTFAVYTTDAVPRMPGVSTANVSPVLMPPHVL